ncbi:MAG: flagellar hook-associated protein FlgK [Nitrospiria bacterium]
MGGISGILNIGASALIANQQALAVTSNNIANANTPGYSQETAVFSENTPVGGSAGQIGTGVQIEQIQRMINQFVNNQLTQEQSKMGQYNISQSTLANVQSLFNDTQGTGIGQALTNLFNDFQNVANTPQSLPARQQLIQDGNTLSQMISNTSSNLTQIQNNLNSQVDSAVNSINTLAGQIAALNGQIAQVQGSGQSANSLLDQRYQDLNQLSSQINISTFQSSSGQITVMVGGGNPLVEGTTANQLKGIVNPNNSGFLDVALTKGNGNSIPLNGSITSGILNGLLNLRDNIIPGDLNQLNTLSATIINEVNQQHQAGYGLDGSTGNNFFSPLSPTVTGSSTNTGTATVSASIAVPSSLTFNPYQLSFSGGNYTLKNMTTGASTTAAYGGATSVTFEGLQVNIGAGAANGDVFNLSETQNVSANMTVSVTDPNKVAAASALAGLPGDNGNALLMAGLSNNTNASLSGATFQGYYSNLTGSVGNQAQTAQNNFSAEQMLQNQLISQQQQTSGVSIDQEMTNLMNYQNAYSAAAQLISTTNQMFQTLIAMPTAL